MGAPRHRSQLWHLVWPWTIGDVASGTSGTLVLKGVPVWLDCRVQGVHRAGDKSIVVGDGIARNVCDGDSLEFRSEYGGITT